MLTPTWNKSTYSTPQNCVEARSTEPTTVDMRDSQSPDQEHLTVPAAEWRAFVSAAANDEL